MVAPSLLTTHSLVAPSVLTHSLVASSLFTTHSQLYSNVSGHVAAPMELGADVPMPLSQQLTQVAQVAGGGGAAGGVPGPTRKRRYCSRPRAVLKSRDWLLPDLLAGIASKMVVAEALGRACDRLRIFIPTAGAGGGHERLSAKASLPEARFES